MPLVLVVLLSGYLAGEVLTGALGVALRTSGVSPDETDAVQAMAGPLVLAGLLLWALMQQRLGRVATGLAVFAFAGLTVFRLTLPAA